MRGRTPTPRARRPPRRLWHVCPSERCPDGRTRRIGGRHQRLERAAGFLARLRRGAGPGGTPGQVVPVRGVVRNRSLPGRGGTARLVAGVPVDVHVGGRLRRQGRLGGTAEARRPGPARRADGVIRRADDLRVAAVEGRVAVGRAAVPGGARVTRRPRPGGRQVLRVRGSGGSVSRTGRMSSGAAILGAARARAAGRRGRAGAQGRPAGRVRRVPCRRGPGRGTARITRARVASVASGPAAPGAGSRAVTAPDPLRAAARPHGLARRHGPASGSRAAAPRGAPVITGRHGGTGWPPGPWGARPGPPGFIPGW